MHSKVLCIFLNAEMSPPTLVVQNESANLIAVFLSIIIIIVRAVSSMVFFSIGYYACGHKCKQSHTNKAMSDPAKKNACCSEASQLPQTPGPLYEGLQPKSTPEH